VGQRLLMMGVLLRLPMALGERDYGSATPIALLAVLGACLALVGHRRFVQSILERLEPYCLARTRDTYGDASVQVIASLAVLAVAGFILRDRELFVVVTAPTAIVGIVMLRRHLRTTRAVLEEAEQPPLRRAAA